MVATQAEARNLGRLLPMAADKLADVMKMFFGSLLSSDVFDNENDDDDDDDNENDTRYLSMILKDH